MQIDLSGQTAIVTGSGRGIGESLAEGLAEAGADVVAAARTESEIAEVSDRLESEYGVDSTAVPTDLRDPDSIDDLYEATIDEFGTPNILVNNAGANISKLPQDMTPEEVDTMLEVNVRGTFLMSQRFGAAFRESSLDSGRIINISSVVAQLGVPAMTMYGGTKGATIALTRGFASEYARDGVTVNSISPGLTRVDRTDVVMEEHGDDLFDFDRIPLGRVGDPEDMAGMCVFLASDWASYITGEDILIDGGVNFTAGLYL